MLVLFNALNKTEKQKSEKNIIKTNMNLFFIKSLG